MTRARPHPSRSGRRIGLPLIAIGAALVVGACATRSVAPNPFDTPQEQRIRIVAINHDFNDATLVALANGENRRLGVVTGKSEQTYTMPWRMVGPLQIQITLLAAGSCTTDVLQVEPGEILELQIRPEAMRAGRCSGPRGDR